MDVFDFVAPVEMTSFVPPSASPSSVSLSLPTPETVVEKVKAFPTFEPLVFALPVLGAIPSLEDELTADVDAILK